MGIRRAAAYYAAGGTVVTFVAGILLWIYPVAAHNPYIPDPRGDLLYRIAGSLLSVPSLGVLVAYLGGWFSPDLGHWDPDASVRNGIQAAPPAEPTIAPGSLALPDVASGPQPMRPSESLNPRTNPPRPFSFENRVLALYAPTAEASVWALLSPLLAGSVLLVLSILRPSGSELSLGYTTEMLIAFGVKLGMLSSAAGLTTFILSLPLGLYGSAREAPWMASFRL